MKVAAVLKMQSAVQAAQWKKKPRTMFVPELSRVYAFLGPVMKIPAA